MLKSSVEHVHFVTLLAHRYRPGMQHQNLRDIFRDTLVLTDSLDETLTAIANKLFGLIIIDLELADFDFISLAISNDCINYHTPVIALLNWDDSIQKKNSIADGFDDCLVKPLIPSNLNNAIMMWREDDALTSSANAMEALLTKTRNNHALVFTLFKKLFEELPQQIGQIEVALKTAQYQFAIDVTHKLNGAAIICCLNHIEIPATALEKCLLQTNYEESENHFFMLKKRISLFLSHRQEILDNLGRLMDKK